MVDAPKPPAASPAEAPIMTLVSAGLFLYVGFWLSLSPTGNSGSVLYDASVNLFTWMARLVGIGLLGVFVLELVRMPGAALLNLVVSAIATLGCLATGLVWVANGDSQGFLVLLFAALNGSATHAAWLALRGRAG